jgi:hypothetical protein
MNQGTCKQEGTINPRKTKEGKEKGEKQPPKKRNNKEKRKKMSGVGWHKRARLGKRK